MKEIRQILKYSWKNQKTDILIGFLVVAILIIWTSCTNGNTPFYINVMDSWWGKWIDPIVGLTTFLLAFFLWISRLRQNWRENLPKRLTVHFKLGDKYILTCHEAYLSAAGDIRAWAQQIGSQMSGARFLEFFPYITQLNPLVKIYNSESYILYEVTLYLKNFPDPNQEKLMDTRILDEYKFWIDNRDDSPANKTGYDKPHPSKALTLDQANNKIMNEEQLK
ncbi:MAG: hypothetical protein IPM48_03900 [Saprospiraceae bacterium]|nr:hypothetical protein [Saprospiraceae bacterium]